MAAFLAGQVRKDLVKNLQGCQEAVLSETVGWETPDNVKNPVRDVGEIIANLQ